MDPVVYLLVAVILAVLILFVSKVRGRAEQADREHQQNVAAAVARPRAQTEERGEGMPRRRRNMGSRLMAQRRAQQTEQEMAEVLEEEEEAPEIQTGKIGAKKQRKLEEKQARKAQREAEETEREERRKMEQKREEERRKDDERSRLEEERQILNPAVASTKLPSLMMLLFPQMLQYLLVLLPESAQHLCSLGKEHLKQLALEEGLCQKRQVWEVGFALAGHLLNEVFQEEKIKCFEKLSDDQSTAALEYAEDAYSGTGFLPTLIKLRAKGPPFKQKIMFLDESNIFVLLLFPSTLILYFKPDDMITGSQVLTNVMYQAEFQNPKSNPEVDTTWREEKWKKMLGKQLIDDGKTWREAEEVTQNQSRSLLQEFVDYIKSSKVVLLEDLGSHFGLRTQDAINRLQELIAEGTLTGVIDDRGKFIYITKEELAAVAQFIRQRGRVSIAELAQASNSLINLKPDINISPGTVV
nr:PREDICTED: DDRGK domain-containing protein 1 [Latimeria chalumnae]|eukprot:XP_014344756.1 PREDICTED: DDRGK domain-containing protein 1 [Latimeria chalumnae]